jgi:copper homeostasis protein
MQGLGVTLVEAAIDALADAERAVKEGAQRLEVCGDLRVGGVTPPRALLGGCLALGVPCVAMARPRAGGFVYDVEEFAAMCEDAERVLEWGAHGVVFGCLRGDGRVDKHQVGAVVALAGYSDTVFHRAFDETPDGLDALSTLIGCGVRRVLTSGHAATAIDGASEIASLVQRSAGRIEILPGGGVRGSNARELVEKTGVVQLHARASEPGVIASIIAAVAA